MHATEIQWYIVVCYHKLSVQQCLCIDTATELNLKGGFCRNPRNPSRSATDSSTTTSDKLQTFTELWNTLILKAIFTYLRMRSGHNVNFLEHSNEKNFKA